MQEPDARSLSRALRRPTIAACALLLTLSAGARAAGPEGGESTWTWLPPGSIYDPYLAEINRPGMGVTLLGVQESGIEGAGEVRFGLKLGGRFGLLRIAPGGDRTGRREGAGRAWQLDLGAGFYGQFDIDNSLDNLGWDGLYSLTLSNAPTAGRGPAFKLGVQHWSSHVGDELSERTGRERIGYTREEIVAGVSLPLVGARTGTTGSGPLARLYGEAAYGTTGNAEDPAGVEIQEPGRVQVGFEWESPGSVGASGRVGWYAALDANSFEERDWNVDLSLGTGLLIDGGDRRWRAGVVLYDGRNPVGEFFRVDERYALLGLWLDLERHPPSP